MTSLTNRAQDWLAQRTRVVPFSPSRVIERPGLFKEQMPLFLRFFLVVAGLVLIGVALVALGFLGLFFWALITA